jgi:hypothetical protein
MGPRDYGGGTSRVIRCARIVSEKSKNDRVFFLRRAYLIERALVRDECWET